MHISWIHHSRLVSWQYTESPQSGIRDTLLEAELRLIKASLMHYFQLLYVNLHQIWESKVWETCRSGSVYLWYRHEADLNILWRYSPPSSWSMQIATASKPTERDSSMLSKRRITSCLRQEPLVQQAEMVTIRPCKFPYPSNVAYWGGFHKPI